LLAAVAWLANVRLQEARRKALLGPTPAERRAEELVESLKLVADKTQLRAVGKELCGRLERAERRRPRIEAIDSVTRNPIPILEWLGNGGEMEDDYTPAVRQLGGTTLDFRGDQLAIARTA
jgi:hypothetical protein